MKTIIRFSLMFMLAAGLVFIMAPTASAQTSQGDGKGFIDVDGDGLNDNARDDDGDGIPNGQDDDYLPPQDGSGAQNNMAMQKKNKGETQEAFRNRIQTFQRTGTMSQVQTRTKGKGNGDGSGSANGGGDCDGTGPKGKSGKK